MGEGTARVVVGRYRLTGPLGRGGMGAVWRAHDTLLGRDVAIKEIWLPSAGDAPVDPADPVVRRALREAQAAARLRHPGIVTVYDVVTDQGRPWIVMELINGRSLAETIREQGLLTEQRTAEIGLQVLDALRAAHREGIAHRDVKPANILLETDRVVLTDFGIAAIEDATALTATGQVVGSPAYLSPERINGQPVTAAADLWALGVTLYLAVTGRSPFQREDTQATLAAILNSQPATPAHAGRLWPVIKGLLTKDPAARLGAEPARQLLANVAQPAGVAGPSTPTRRRPRWWPAKAPSSTLDGGLPDTVAAPSPTLAAPTALQEPEGPTVAAETVAAVPLAPYPETASPRRAGRTRNVWLAALGVAAVLLAGGLLRIGWHGGGRGPVAAPSAGSQAIAGGPSVKPSAKSSVPVNPALDGCLVGTWRMTSMQIINHFEGIDARFTSSGGVITRIWPSGKGVDDYNKSAPLTATIKGYHYVEVLRGVRTSFNETANGHLRTSQYVGGPTYKVTRNGKVQAIEVHVTASDDLPYSCSETRLTTYGNEKVSTQSFVRISHEP